MVDSNEVQSTVGKKYLWDASALVDYVRLLFPFDINGELTDWLVAGFKKGGSFFLQKAVLSKELQGFLTMRRSTKVKNTEVSWQSWEKLYGENMEQLLFRLGLYKERKGKDGKSKRVKKNDGEIEKIINYVSSKEIINPEEHKLILEKWATEEGKRVLLKKQLDKMVESEQLSNEKLNKTQLDEMRSIRELLTEKQLNGSEKKTLNEKVTEDVRREAEKELKLGDFQLIFHARENKEFDIIANESSSSNNHKLFHKIPVICGMEGIACTDLTQFLKNNAKGLHLKFEGSHQT